jgi:Reverse transcriptase (RNA-dependent DNA polymerase)
MLLTDNELRVWITLGAALRFGMMTLTQAKFRITNFGFHNFSTVEFDRTTCNLLGMGLKFIPFPRAQSTDDLLRSFDLSVRSIRLARFFAERNVHGGEQDRAPVPLRFVRRSPAFDPKMGGDLEQSVLIARDVFRSLIDESLSRVPRSHLAPSRIPRVLRRLVRPDVTFKVADKNLGLVCVQRAWYDTQCRAYLEDRTVFKPIPAAGLRELFRQAKEGFIRACDLSCVEVSEPEVRPSSWRPVSFQDIPLEFLVNSVMDCTEMVPAEMYGIIKVHKEPKSIRPITPAHSVMGAVIADWVCTELQQFVWESPFVLRDSRTLVRRLEALQLRPGRRYAMITFDVENMYPSLPRDRLRARLEDFFTPHVPQRGSYLPWLLNLIEWVQQFHLIRFQDSFFLQISGTAMGIHFGPLVANAFMASLERQFQREWNLRGHSWPVVYSRYIDDGFVLLELPESYVGPLADCPLVRDFVHGISHLDPAIRLKIEMSEESAVMLDLNVIRSGSRLLVSTFSKPMNKFLYVPFASCHTRENLKGFINAELLRFAVTNSLLADFQKARLAFFDRLVARGYPDSFLRPLFASVSHPDRNAILARVNEPAPPRVQSRTVFFKTTTDRNSYSNHLELSRLLRYSLRDVLSHPSVQMALSADRPLMVSYKRAPNLRDLLRKAERDMERENAVRAENGRVL